MEVDEAVTLAGDLAAAYPGYNFAEATMRQWAELFLPETTDLITKAMARVTYLCRRPPSIADVKEAIRHCRPPEPFQLVAQSVGDRLTQEEATAIADEYFRRAFGDGPEAIVARFEHLQRTLSPEERDRLARAKAAVLLATPTERPVPNAIPQRRALHADPCVGHYTREDAEGHMICEHCRGDKCLMFEPFACPRFPPAPVEAEANVAEAGT